MAIKTVLELGRETTHLLGSTPEYTRTVRVELTAPVPTALVVLATGLRHGSPHPEFYPAKCYNLDIKEEIIEDISGQDENPATLATTIIAQYRIEEEPVLPWQRKPVWRFLTQGAGVPALYYYDNTTAKPLTNSAGDYYEGLTVDEAQQKITIQSNRETFPSALAAAVTNCVNDSSYLGFPADCVKVQGISGEISTEMINEQEVRYWKVTAELLGRQTGWNLLLPDIGFNYVEGGVKKRATVDSPDGPLPSANPVALNGSGGLQAGGTLPAILTRRVYTRIPMGTFFGVPPN